MGQDMSQQLSLFGEEPTHKLDLLFDHKKILESLGDLLSHDEFIRSSKLLVTHYEDDGADFISGATEFDEETKTFKRPHKASVYLNPRYRGTYMEYVVDTIARVVGEHGHTIDRVRVLKLNEKKAYCIHKDEGGYNIHIPLVTNYRAIFISNGKVECMHEHGRAYSYLTKTFHTALNASESETRVHLIFAIADGS